MSRRLATLLLLSGGLLYANWLFQLVLPVHLSPLTSYVSELSALSHPYHQAFRAMDIVSGLAVIAGAACGMSVGRRDRAAATVWIALALFGMSNILDALTPLDCTLTVRAACNASTTPDVWRWIGDPHMYASLGEEVFFVVALVALVISLRAAHAPIAVRRFAEVLGYVTVCTSIIAGMLTADLNFFRQDMLLGLVQRAEVLFMALWVALVPRVLITPELRPTQRAPGHTHLAAR